MARITWEAIKIIIGIALDVADLVKGKLKGEKDDGVSTNSKA